MRRMHVIIYLDSMCAIAIWLCCIIKRQRYVGGSDDDFIYSCYVFQAYLRLDTDKQRDALEKVKEKYGVGISKDTIDLDKINGYTTPRRN